MDDIVSFPQSRQLLLISFYTDHLPVNVNALSTLDPMMYIVNRKRHTSSIMTPNLQCQPDYISSHTMARPHLGINLSSVICSSNEESTSTASDTHIHPPIYDDHFQTDHEFLTLHLSTLFDMDIYFGMILFYTARDMCFGIQLHYAGSAAALEPMNLTPTQSNICENSNPSTFIFNDVRTELKNHTYNTLFMIYISKFFTHSRKYQHSIIID